MENSYTIKKIEEGYNILIGKDAGLKNTTGSGMRESHGKEK